MDLNAEERLFTIGELTRHMVYLNCKKKVQMLPLIFTLTEAVTMNYSFLVNGDVHDIQIIRISRCLGGYRYAQK